MKLSFVDEESFKEAVESLYCDPNAALQRRLTQDSEMNEEICINNSPSDSEYASPSQM